MIEGEGGRGSWGGGENTYTLPTHTHAAHLNSRTQSASHTHQPMRAAFTATVAPTWHSTSRTLPVVTNAVLKPAHAACANLHLTQPPHTHTHTLHNSCNVGVCSTAFAPTITLSTTLPCATYVHTTPLHPRRTLTAAIHSHQIQHHPYTNHHSPRSTPFQRRRKSALHKPTLTAAAYGTDPSTRP
jgi:hypothetical protein